MARGAKRAAQISQMALVRLIPLGDRGLTIELPEADPERVFGLAGALQRLIDDGALPGASELLPAMRSVSLFFDPLTAEPDSWSEKLLALAAAEPRQAGSGRQVEIPVCFDQDYGPELAAMAGDREAFISQFLAAGVTVRFLGFMPGFAYLGDVPEPLRAPRLTTPRSSVPAGSVGIAGQFCAVYPWNSPGGWNLIGRTPLSLFDPGNSERPALLAPGDRVVWRRIARWT